MIDPQMRCAELVELVTDWMEDALDDRTISRLEEHLVICPPCSEYVDADPPIGSAVAHARC